MRDEGGVGLGQVVPDALAAGEVPEQQVCLLAAEDPLRQDVQVVDRRQAPDEPELVVGGIAEHVDEYSGLQAIQQLALVQKRHNHEQDTVDAPAPQQNRKRCVKVQCGSECVDVCSNSTLTQKTT